MFFECDADFKGLRCVCPVEHTGFLRENLELPELFALGLYDIQSMESAIDHQEARLEADELGEREWLRQESHHGYEFKHSLGLSLLPVHILDLNRLRLQFGEIKR